MFSRSFKRVGLHYTAFRDAIREDSRQTTPSRGVTPRKKFAVEANVESRVSVNINQHPANPHLFEEVTLPKNQIYIFKPQTQK